MIHELEWDSSFFKRKIGEIKESPEHPALVEAALKKAKEESFEYVMYRLHSHETTLARYLTSLGFYLSDICVTWAICTEQYSYMSLNGKRPDVRVATNRDIPALKTISKSLFLDSIFYNDPFFSKEDADNLYGAWIENSIKGEAADNVLYIPRKGFITCKILSSVEGRIVLIGVRSGCRGKSLGSVLMEEALRWFEKRGITQIWARTQLKNLNAMNFYNKLGFYIKEYDMVYVKIIDHAL